MQTEARGMDAETGGYVDGWDHVVQSLARLFATMFFERVMRPHVGSMARKLFGELANVNTAHRFRWAIATAISLFEPRVRPVWIAQVGLDRTGDTEWRIEVDYMPRGHLGDFTVAGRRTLTISGINGRNGPAVTG